jgi:hypothetical protein
MNLLHVSVLLDPFCCPPFLSFSILYCRLGNGLGRRRVTMNLLRVSVLLDPFCCPPFLFSSFIAGSATDWMETRNYEPSARECFAWRIRTPTLCFSLCLLQAWINRIGRRRVTINLLRVSVLLGAFELPPSASLFCLLQAWMDRLGRRRVTMNLCARVSVLLVLSAAHHFVLFFIPGLATEWDGDA